MQSFTIYVLSILGVLWRGVNIWEFMSCVWHISCLMDVFDKLDQNWYCCVCYDIFVFVTHLSLFVCFGCFIYLLHILCLLHDKCLLYYITFINFRLAYVWSVNCCLTYMCRSLNFIYSIFFKMSSILFLVFIVFKRLLFVLNAFITFFFIGKFRQVYTSECCPFIYNSIRPEQGNGYCFGQT